MNTKIIVLLSLIVILLSSFPGMADEDHTIYLKAGNIDTDNNSVDNVSSSRIALSGSDSFDSTEKYYIVQFDGHVSEEWKKEIENTGAEFFDYIPENSYILRMNSSVMEQVDSLDFIRWTGEYLPEYKYEYESGNESEKQVSLFSDDSVSEENLTVVLFDSGSADEISQSIENIGGTVTAVSGNILGLTIPSSAIDELASIEGISWMEYDSEPVSCNDVATDIMNVRVLNENSGLQGSGQIVAVSDTGIDTGVDDSSMHADLRGRLLQIIDYSDDGPEDEEGHGTLVAGSIIGNGAMSDGQYSGAAPQASLVFEAIQDDDGSLGGIQKNNLKKIFQDAYDYGARIHSNSWGYTDDLGNYSIVSMQVDEFVWNNPDMLILFSAGNEASDSDSNGVVDENSVTPPATSKNCIAVGATESYRPGTSFRYTFPVYPIKGEDIADDADGMYASSGRGPTDDGRIKPDLVAPGTLIASTKSSLVDTYKLGIINDYYAYAAGTSFSTPLVAGTAAVVREYYTDIENLASPSAALLKATLINGAYDISPGQYGEGTYQEVSERPDNSQGWGRVDASNSIMLTYPQVLAYYDDVSLEDSASWQYSYDYIKDSENLRATLVWSDYPSSPASSKTLYNDLDLTLSTPSGTYYGNDGPDHVNNAEGIELDSTDSGEYTVKVNAYDVQHGPQPFALVLSFTCDNSEYPENGSYAASSMDEISSNAVHPMGVKEGSVSMEIDGNAVSFNSESIDDGYSVKYTPSSPYQSGEHTVTVSAQTDSGQEFSYSWSFKVKPEISSFTFADPDVTGVISQDEKTISVTVPSGTDLTSLKPSVVHNGASVSPASGQAQDFTNPVTYTVTANDGTTQSYKVSVKTTAGSSKEITSFSFSNPAATGLIDDTAKTITLTVPSDTDVTALVPSVVHTGKEISPASGQAQDFTSPVIYTVTAEDGSTQAYTVSVNKELSSSKAISSFKFEDIGVDAVISEAEATITASVAYGTDVTDLVPSVVHNGTSVSPASGQAQDFTNPVIYTVTAEDGSSKAYTVTVSKLAETSKAITDFRFTETDADSVIDQEGKTITVDVPAGTNISSLTPEITYTGQSITPESGVSENFTDPVNYTVTGSDGSALEYTVIVNVEANTEKAITSFRFPDPDVTGTISEEGKTITMTVPYGTDVTALEPEITYTGQSVEPESMAAQNFTDTVNYTVTAEDGSTVMYAVSVTVASSTDRSITSFVFEDISVEGVIDENEKTISLVVPENTNVSSLTPTITHTGVNITPGNRIAQNFTNPVVYTVTAGDSGTSNYTATVSIKKSSDSSASGSGGGGGGGGGGGSTGEEYENIELKDVSSEFVGKDRDIMFEFQTDGNDISYVAYRSLKNSGTISVTIEVLKDKSGFADSLPSGDVYKNINIWVGKVGYATSENIENPVIGFRVPLSWIEENNIDADSIALNRYDDGWDSLSTSKTGEDGDYIYFEAQTPGFSPFAITGESIASEEKMRSAADDDYSADNRTLNSSLPEPSGSRLDTLSFLSSVILISLAYVLRKRY